MTAQAMSLTFGPFLRQLRQRAGMTQTDLAAAVGYSPAFISNLEKEARQPNLEIVAQRFVPALALQDEPKLAARLIELAALARGMRPPASTLIHGDSRLGEVADSGAGHGNLPASPTPLIGRASDVDWICKRLLGHHGRLMTLLGPPGVGKTRLALEAASRLQAIYADGACFVALDAVDDPSLVPLTIAAALGLEDTGVGDPQGQVIEYLRRKEMLLVLDNFEQILPAAAQVAALLAACPGLRIIVTSRERLHLRAEQRYRVEPLPVDDAISLFLGAVALAAPDFAASDADRPLLKQLCLELDCLPLALELAAAHIEFGDVSTLLQRLRSQRLDVLTGGPGDLPERQRALRAAIADSYCRLQPSEQALFRALGLFAGGFDLEAVGAFGFAASDLEALLRTHLAQRLGGAAPRFGMLETLRAFALERLAASQELASARRRHAAYFLDLVEQAEPVLYGPEKTGWFHRLAAEIHNLRAAIQHALEDGDLATAARLCVGLRQFWTMQSHLEEGRLWLDRVLAGGRVDDLPPGLRIRLYNSRGAIAFYQQDYGEARECFGMALALAQETSDEWGLAFALDGLGAEAANRGDFAGAAVYSRRSLALSQAGGHTWLEAITLINLGEIARLQDNAEQAAACYEESLGLLRQVGDGSFTAVTLINLAQLAIDAEHWQRARALACESLQLGVRTEQPRIIAHSLDKLAAVAAFEGDPRLAGKLFGAAGRLRDEHSIAIQPADRDDYVRLIERARLQGNPDDFETALRAGHRMPVSDALALAVG